MLLFSQNIQDKSGLDIRTRDKVIDLLVLAIRILSKHWKANVGGRFLQIVLLAFTFSFASAAAPKPVLTGIDVLKAEEFQRLRGKKIGLITNHTGQDGERNSIITLLKNAPGLELKILFSPEHGIDGNSDAQIDHAVHQPSGLPVVSLYGVSPRRTKEMSDAEYDAAVLQSRRPPIEHLRGLDALVYDIQDGGARFYTRIAILGGAIQSAAEASIPIYILDRPNPISGRNIEGPVQTRHSSFVGYHNIPVRHGMTVGELAKMYNAEKKFGADVRVVEMRNWRRDMRFDETGLPWINLSPALRTLHSVELYPGICLMEATSISVGRGSDFSFQAIGAPYIDDRRLARELNQLKLPGIRFVPIQFVPDPNLYVGPAQQLPFRGTNCAGVQIFLTDRDVANVVEAGVAMALTLHRLYPQEFKVERMSKLLGHNATLEAIRSGKSLPEIRQLWHKDFEAFQNRRKTFLLYK